MASSDERAVASRPHEMTFVEIAFRTGLTVEEVTDLYLSALNKLHAVASRGQFEVLLHEERAPHGMGSAWLEDRS